MSTASEPVASFEPLMPMPALTVEGLRVAVAQLTPSRIQAFHQDLVEATTSAQEALSLSPVRIFVHRWALFVATQRYPSRVARLRELEGVIGRGEQDPGQAMAEIVEINNMAHAEVGL